MNRRKILILVLIVLLVAVVLAFVNLSTAIGESQPPTNKLPTVERHAGATGQCVSGKYTYATHRSGACSSNGGVKEWYS